MDQPGSVLFWVVLSLTNPGVRAREIQANPPEIARYRAAPGGVIRRAEPASDISAVMAALNTWAGCRGEAQSRKPLDFTLPGRQREAMAGVDHDLVLAGGGLAAGLVALAFR